MSIGAIFGLPLRIIPVCMLIVLGFLAALFGFIGNDKYAEQIVHWSFCAACALSAGQPLSSIPGPRQELSPFPAASGK
jgi:hypothetical protein